MVRRVHLELGTRGELLLWCAAVWFVFGVGILAESADRADPSLLHLHMPEPIRVGIWWGGVAVAIYAAITKRHVAAAVGVLIVAPIVRAASYLWAWFTYISPVSEQGHQDGAYIALFYLALIALVFIIARVKEPTLDGAP